VKLVDEYRDSDVVARLAAGIRRTATRPWTLMEICGGQTHSIVKNGLEALLPPGIELVHGPGCPVCVTPAELIDAAVALAARPEVIFTSYGDMLRVPGSRGRAEGPAALLDARAAGADVRVVYSALDAVQIAAANPGRQVVFFAVGFETTAPGHALAVLQAAALGLENFSILVAHVLVPPAIDALLGSPECRVQALLAPGHVCTIGRLGGIRAAERALEGADCGDRFEPVDLMEGILMAVRQLEAGQARLENQYSRAVRADGNAPARAAVERVFEVTDRPWRGLGMIAGSGLALRPGIGNSMPSRDSVRPEPVQDDGACISGLILQG